jgi:sugar phosphate permease
MLKGAKGEINLSLEQWIVGITGFLTLFALVGIMFYGLPFFYDFWVRDFGWSRARVTSGNAFGKIIVGLFGFMAGWIIDRFGLRKLMLIGIFMSGISVIALSMMTSLWQFYLIYIFIGLGYMCGGPLPIQVLISRWFDKKRGKVMGIAYVGIGIGGMLVPQMAKWLNLHFGWHKAIVILGVLMILIAIPIAWFVKENPDNGTKKKITEPEMLLAPIFKSRSFYLLAIGSMCSVAAVSGTIQNLKLFFSFDLKYSQQLSANVLSLILLSSTGGRLLVGWLADKLPKKFVMILISGIVIFSILLLFFASSRSIIYLFAIIFGIGLGGDYMIIPLMAAELFGIRVMGRIMGIILTIDGFADALAPMLVGWLRDRLGNYANAFTVLIFLALIGIIAIAMIPRKTNTA